MEVYYLGIPIIISYITAQLLKAWFTKTWSIWKVFMRRGGMFSAHSAVMVSMVTVLWWAQGFTYVMIVALTYAFLFYSEVVDRKKHVESHTLYQLINGGLVGLAVTGLFILISNSL